MLSDNEKIDRVVRELESLRNDELFQMDLKDPMCLRAIEYWTTTPEQRDTRSQEKITAQYHDNYKVESVFNKLKKLQFACKQIPMGVPLKAVLAGEIDPLFGLERPKKKSVNKPAAELYKKPETAVEEPGPSILTKRNVALWWTVQVAFIAVALRFW